MLANAKLLWLWQTHSYAATPNTGGLDRTTLTAHAIPTMTLVTVSVTLFLYSLGLVILMSL